jgi:ABC-type bacteriocin/lantibiotic exporter with double-glycine peptidase domain
MVRDAPVLILDEPTTGLDTPTARRVLGPLRRLMAGRTTILITHDLHLAPEADKVIALDGKRSGHRPEHDPRAVRKVLQEPVPRHDSWLQGEEAPRLTADAVTRGRPATGE